ncbi:unnamed protein product, partial [Onchocerca ochengi]|uniref:Myb domain-containing protein n=1 Tax=Onchocerca ochengi TaxID=42157 RepID=A0A182EQT2_ONCOC
MAIDVINDQQQLINNYHSTHNLDTLTYTVNNNNINIDNDDNDNDGNNSGDDLNDNDMQRHHRTMQIVRRRKRFATAQTSRWDKMTSDYVLKLKWFISRYTRDISRSEI